MNLQLAARIARREMRGGLRGFRLLLACLALGVAAIAAVGSVRASIEAGLTREGATILGGDAEIELGPHRVRVGPLDGHIGPRDVHIGPLERRIVTLANGDVIAYGDFSAPNGGTGIAWNDFPGDVLRQDTPISYVAELVPEPSTFLLLATGLLGFTKLRPRR